MPEPLWARGEYARTVGGLGVGMPELLGAFGLLCRNFSGRRGGYAGIDVRSGGVGRNFWGLKGGVCRKFCGLKGGVCRKFCGLTGG